MSRPVCCLFVGGSDSSGGAGVQADLLAGARMGVHGCTVVTALTAQHPTQIVRIEPVPLAHMEAELHAVFDYYDVAAVKTGMLLDAEHVALLHGVLAVRLAGRPLVVDPVMRASSGRALLADTGRDALAALIAELATLVTPNLHEARAFSGASAREDEETLLAALAERWPGRAILLKGGHASASDTIVDRLRLADGTRHDFRHARRRLDAHHGHGTGCRLAALIAAALAQGDALPQACDRAETMLAGWLAEP